jgi:hypothetical protein
MSEAFDRLARRLASGGSRRDTLKAVGGFLARGFHGRGQKDEDGAEGAARVQ